MATNNLSGIKHIISKILKRKDFANMVIDLQTYQITPTTSIYQAPGKFPLLCLPIQHFRGLSHIGCSCATNSDHPFIKTLIAYGKGQCKAYKNSPLEKYYENFQPKTAAETLGVSDSTYKLSTLTALQSIEPWNPSIGAKMNPESREKSRMKCDDHESLHKKKIDQSLPYQGFKFWGPLTTLKGQVEFERLVSVYESIQKHGYTPKDNYNGHIAGSLLTNEKGEYAIIIRTGQHRIAALSALGYRAVPAIIKSDSKRPIVINRKDVNNWPYVVNGYFSKNQALEIFDRIMKGLPPYLKNR